MTVKSGTRLIINKDDDIPESDRKFTDTIWLLFFLIAIVCWCGSSAFVISNGNVGRRFAPVDSEGRKCGYDPQVIDKPYLLYFDLKKCFFRYCRVAKVCVTRCPQMNFLYASSYSLEYLKSKVICKHGIALDNVNKSQLQRYVYQGHCAKYYLNSTEMFGHCTPNEVWRERSWLTLDEFDLASGKQFIRYAAYWRMLWNDIQLSKHLILGSAVGSGIVSVVCIILCKWFAREVIIVNFLIFCALFGYLIYVGFNLLTSFVGIWLINISILFLLIGVTCPFTQWKRISVVADHIKESSKELLCMPSNLLVPLVQWILRISLLAFFLYLTISVESIENNSYKVELLGDGCKCPKHLNYTSGSVCKPELFYTQCKAGGLSCSVSACRNFYTFFLFEKYLLHIFNVLVYLWVYLFIMEFGQNVLAGNIAKYVWTPVKSNVSKFTILHSAWRAFRYHIGSIAFASVSVTGCRVLRFMALLGQLSQMCWCLMCGILTFCCMNDLQRLMKRIQKFCSYICMFGNVLCAIHGTNFIPSLKSVYDLLPKNMLQIVILDEVRNWVLVSFRLSLSAAAVVISYLYLKDSRTETINFVMLASAVATYEMATVFFSVYHAAVNSLIICSAEDVERHDGTAAKPYRMPNTVRQILISPAGET